MKEQFLFASLAGHQYIALTTYRKNGTPMVTPVWFVKQGERLIVWTAKDSGKAKRIKNNPSVRLGASNHSGKLLGHSSFDRVMGLGFIDVGSQHEPALGTSPQGV